MDYRCISADCHIDINWLPHDLFVANATQAMKDRMPYVTECAGGLSWVTKGGVNFGYAGGRGSGLVTGVNTKYKTGREYRIDRMASTGLYTDGAQGIFRPSDPVLRLQDQDRDGVQAEVMYGLLGAGNKMTDREASVEFYRIYNDWLCGFCGHNLARFVGLASIPSHSVDAAVAETRRVAKLAGIGGVDISFSYDMQPLWHPAWDTFWQAAADVDLPVHFHTVRQSPPVPVAAGLPEYYSVVSDATRMAGFQLYMANILAAVINGGALERHPKLRIVLGESGIGWIPYVLQRMDDEYEERFKHDLPIKMKPSEYWYRQCRATFQNDVVGTHLLDLLGLENVMWGSDYPHPDGVFPDSQDYIKRQFGHLPGATQRKLICENVGKFYKLI